MRASHHQVDRFGDVPGAEELRCPQLEAAMQASFSAHEAALPTIR